ncbi:MAG: histidine phosphatase family protein [Bacteroidales bacterium]|nr:histidine phosphatase family protein [Bacteroidales bacterium]
MKTLYLVRHAKASWEEPGVSDIKRPLVPRGVEKTGRIVKFLQQRLVTIDLIISSPATRAYHTAKIISKGIGFPQEKIKIERRIYDGYMDKILDIIYETDPGIHSVMVLGHNPMITHVANLFLHPGIEFIPTSGMVCVSFNVDSWEKVPSVEAKQEFIIFPKMLK